MDGSRPRSAVPTRDLSRPGVTAPPTVTAQGAGTQETGLAPGGGYRASVSTSAPPTSLLRRTITSVVVGALLLAAGMAGFQRLSALKKESERSIGGAGLPVVRVETAERSAYTETVRGYGRARALRLTDVPSEVATVVTYVSPALEAGAAIDSSTDESSTGTTNGGGAEDDNLPVLVRLDARDLKDAKERASLERDAAQADVKRFTQLGESLAERLVVSKEEVATARREYERIEKLVPKTLPQSDLDRQQLQVSLRRLQVLDLESRIEENGHALEAAKARLEALAKAADIAERNLERAVIRAPFPGRIVDRHVQLGDHVQPGEPLFRIVDLSRVEVPVALPAGRYGDVRVGSPARLTHARTGEELWTGTVARVAPDINTSERTFFAFLVVEGTPTANPITPGSHVLAEIEGRTYENVIAIPRRALLGDIAYVAKPTPEGPSLIEERHPILVRLLPGEALVVGGLEAGDRYLVTNLESVAAGSRVRIAGDPEQPDPGR